MLFAANMRQQHKKAKGGLFLKIFKKGNYCKILANLGNSLQKRRK